MIISLVSLSDVDVYLSGQLPCSLFCKCGGSDSCCNQMTKNNMANDYDDDEEHSDDEDGGDEDEDED